MKTLSKLGTEENFLSLIIPTANIILGGQELNVFPLGTGTKTRMCAYQFYSFLSGDSTQYN